jgi:hypothetical protein
MTRKRWRKAQMASNQDSHLKKKPTPPEEEWAVLNLINFALKKGLRIR